MADTTAGRRASRSTLDIQGPANATVVVFRQAATPLPAISIFEGQLPDQGLLCLRVPCALLRVLVGTYEATVDCTNPASRQRVDARPPIHHRKEPS